MSQLPRQFQLVASVLGLFMALTTLVSADDRFALAVGARDMLVIFGPKGDRVAELPVPSISQPVTIGATSFQVSYGRDANNMLTAILAPNPSQPQDLHFNVLNKAVDADKQAVVTLTFTNGMSRVSVDPGYVGTVAVNSRSVRHREIADESPSPASVPDMTPQVRTTSTVAPRDLPSSTPSYDSAPAPSAAPSDITSTKPAPAAPDATAAASAAPSGPMYWSEPITAPDGSAPKVGLNQMKLVEVKGSVSVKAPDGNVRDGHDGMILPSGSTLISSDDSSAAVFMGGVNSARLLPNTDVKVSQTMDGSVRKTSLDLKNGSVFSRVGRRPGETQDYQVHTPEGVAAARGTEYATVVRNGHTYVFVAKGSVAMFEGGREYKIVLGSADIGKGAMPAATPAEVAAIFVDVISQLQEFNGKLATIIAARDAGTPLTPQQQAYLANVIRTDSNSDPIAAQILAGTTVDINNPNPLPSDYVLAVPINRNFVRTIYQDFYPFGTQPTTPY